MAEQLQACAPIDEPSWKAPGDHAIVEPDIVDMLNRYESVSNGTEFVTSSGLVVRVSDVISWYETWKIKSNDFRIWCRQQALVVEAEGELEEYFGPTSEILNFTKHSISWPKWFKANLDALEQEKISLTEVFSKQLQFERSIGYDFVGSPYLFPTRSEVLSLIKDGVKNKAIPSSVLAEPRHGKHVRCFEGPSQQQRGLDYATIEMMNDVYNELGNLKERWRNYPDSVLINQELVVDAANRYIRGEYDRIAVYEAHKARVKAWADDQAMRMDASLLTKPTHEMAIIRFTLATMVSCEKLIEDEIDKYARSANTGPRRMDKSRLNQLRKGTAFRP